MKIKNLIKTFTILSVICGLQITDGFCVLHRALGYTAGGSSVPLSSATTNNDYQQISQLQSTISTQNSTINSLNSSITSLNNDKSNLNAQITDLNSKIKEKDLVIDNLNKQIDILNESVIQLKVDILNLERKNVELVEENKLLNTEVLTLRQCWFVRMFSCLFPKKPIAQNNDQQEIEMSETTDLDNNLNNADLDEIRPAEVNK